MRFAQLTIPEIILIEPDLYCDERGSLAEIYKRSEFLDFGIADNFVQDNHSVSGKNVLRGLHYQVAPKEQAKLIRCVRGRVFDVAVDIRRRSPTFGRWAGTELSEENRRMIYIPAGFAHGFVALTEPAEVHYKCSAEYSKDHDRGILWNDPDINIAWPVGKPVLSERDKQFRRLKESEAL